MNKKVNTIMTTFIKEYGEDFKCYLNHSTPEELLIATMLSAQCTDARVNVVTEKLFTKYPNVEAFANADLNELKQDIYQTGFYHNKAKNIIATCKILIEKYNGKVVNDIAKLTELPGVGRKTANVIRGNIFKEPSVVVDTHVKRISKRLGLTKEDDPVKIEYELMKKIPRDYWILINIHFIRFGREICMARSPKCELCFIKGECNYYGQ